MNEEIHTRIAALNAAWQRYTRAIEQELDTVPMAALNRDYLAAWEGLDACGIAEWMLVYDPVTFTFSLSTTDEFANHDFATIPLPAMTAGSWWRNADPGSKQMQ